MLGARRTRTRRDESVSRSSGTRRGNPLRGYVADQLVDSLRLLFDRAYYEAQVGQGFEDEDTALLHYLEQGATSGYEPHPLFDTEYYLRQEPLVASSRICPLVHFLEKSIHEVRDPSPYFDVEYYLRQMGRARAPTNALAHYVRYAAAGKACNPNPLFGNGYYLNLNPDVKSEGKNPFAHFLSIGWRQRRLASRVHQRITGELGPASRRPLLRGQSGTEVVLFFAHGQSRAELPLAVQETLEREHALATIVVFVGGPALSGPWRRQNVLVLDDYKNECEISRPAALRLLAKMLGALEPKLAITDVTVVLDGLRDAGIPSYLLLDGPDAIALPGDLETFASRATRVVFTARARFEDGDIPQGLPANIAIRPYPSNVERTGGPAASSGLQNYVRSLFALAARDGELSRAGAAVRTSGAPIRKIIIPCADWQVSGVNRALEAIGGELERRAWEIQIVFTRDQAMVFESAGGADGLPALSHRFLARERSGPEGMWEALVRDLEENAPCIVLTAYDFVANSVVPALTEEVGVIMWVQSDDGDYYEQLYRLGRYCNAIVCVSSHIWERVVALHPVIGERSQVVHNTTVSEGEVVTARRKTSDISIVYAGRLSQYQKRVLDFVELADALERRDVPFVITLIGTFPVHDSAAQAFSARAARHLETGRVRLLGPLSRERLFAELAVHAFFVLLSDFEGFPLSLVEAMACGCVPVVADMASGIPEVVNSGKNGVIVRGRDYDRWAGIISSLWQDQSQLTAMGAEASETIRARFTVEQAAARFDEVLRRVAAEIADGAYVRPPSLHWGEQRSLTGDVLPPPMMYRPVSLPGLA